MEARRGASTLTLSNLEFGTKTSTNLLGQPVLGGERPPSGTNRALCGESHKDTAWPRPLLSPKLRSLDQLDQHRTGGYGERLLIT